MSGPLGREVPAPAVDGGRRRLDHPKRVQERARKAAAADGEVLDRARRLHAVVRLGWNVQLAQRIALNAERYKSRG